MRIGRDSTVEVLRSEVDSAGYDLVMECGGRTRYIELKSSREGSRAASQTVNVKLQQKPGGCVIWLLLERSPSVPRYNLDYLVFGRKGGQPMPPLDEFKSAKQTRADSEGNRKERPNTRVIPRSQFKGIESTSALIDWLLGSPPGHSVVANG